MERAILNDRTIPEGEHFYVTFTCDQCERRMNAFHFNLHHYEVVLMTRGVCFCSVERDNYQLPRGGMALMNRGSSHFHSFDPNEVHEIYHVMFDERYADQFRRQSGIDLMDILTPDAACVVEEGQVDGLARMLDRVLSASGVEQAERMVRTHYLDIFFVHLARLKKDALLSAQFSAQPTLLRALGIIQREYAEPLTLSGVAARLNLSKQYLCRLFHAETGYTFTQQLHQTRIRAACRLLESQRLTLDEVAAQCGFSGAAHLCSVFRAQLGLSPRAWLKSRR